MIAKLRLHAEQYPGDERLKEVIRTVRTDRTDATARKLWDSPDLPSVTHPSFIRPPPVPGASICPGRAERNSPSASWL
ncbi:hypothetical protein AB0O01_35770 [Streptomyces sp. NPDC093252]|uniref:hypothetical protein n=1 Tax=Streptomyces sp. NPDC093252 TaxID=3154980 RepID=UPI00342D9FA0